MQLVGDQLFGQVPHKGLFTSLNAESNEKKLGSTIIVGTHQSINSWSKDFAPLNIPDISRTDPTFQSPKSWLNNFDPPNMNFMSRTSETCQLPMF